MQLLNKNIHKAGMTNFTCLNGVLLVGIVFKLYNCFDIS